MHGSFGTIRADFVANTLLLNQQLTSFDVDMDDLYLQQHFNFLSPSRESRIYCDLNESVNVLSFVAKIKQASPLLI